MKYIGIDASLTATGLVILNEDLSIVKQEVISSKEKEVERLVEISESLSNSLMLYVEEDPLIFLEGYSFGSRVGQAFSIGELGGVIKYQLHFLGLKFQLIPPTVLKKFITGKGNSKKELILKEVFKKWGIDLNDNNLADAYGLARMAWAKQHTQNLLNYEKEVIRKL